MNLGSVQFEVDLNGNIVPFSLWLSHQNHQKEFAMKRFSFMTFFLFRVFSLIFRLQCFFPILVDNFEFVWNEKPQNENELFKWKQLKPTNLKFVESPSEKVIIRLIFTVQLMAFLFSFFIHVPRSFETMKIIRFVALLYLEKRLNDYSIAFFFTTDRMYLQFRSVNRLISFSHDQQTTQLLVKRFGLAPSGKIWLEIDLNWIQLAFIWKTWKLIPR